MKKVNQKKPTFEIKNHVNTDGTKTIFNLLGDKYGFGMKDIDSALKGDTKAIQKLGEGARQSKRILELMPIIEQHCLDIIGATVQRNVSEANIAIAGAKGSTQINKAKNKALQANAQYLHSVKEIKEEYVHQKKFEDQRHEDAMNFIKLKAYIDSYVYGVDTEAKVLQQSNAPAMKQLSVDEQYFIQSAKHILSYGDQAQVELIPKKEYVQTQNNNQQKGIKQSAQSVLKSLGVGK